MTDKIQEITQKIYNEGVIKAKEDADKIIADAKIKAEAILLSAKKMQEEIIDKAQKQAEEIKRKTNTEMQLAARQFTSKLKQNITGVISTSQVDGTIRDAVNDIDFIKNIIQIIVSNWKPEKSEDLNIKLLLPEKNEKAFTAFFDSKINETLNKGVEVKFDSKLDTGFQIGPHDGSYILSFTDKDFENYFKSYFKERTKKLLFDSEQQE